jgi:hypothetical protein
MVDDQNQPERPRTEPEIIPPDHTGGRGSNSPSQQPWQQSWQTSWGQDGARRTQRVFVMRPPGPLGFAVLMLVLALIVAAIFVTIIGAFLIWIPVVALFVAVAAVYRFLRR